MCISHDLYKVKMQWMFVGHESQLSTFSTSQERYSLLEISVCWWKERDPSCGAEGFASSSWSRCEGSRQTSFSFALKSVSFARGSVWFAARWNRRRSRPKRRRITAFRPAVFHTYFQSHHTTSLAPLDHLSLLTCSCPLLLNHFRSLHLVLVGSSSYFGCLTLSGSKSPLPKKRWYKIKNVVLTSWFLSRWLKIVEDSWKALEIDELVLSLKLFVCTVAKKTMKRWKISWQRMIYNEEFCTVCIDWMKIKVEKYVEIFVDIWFW